MTHPASGHLFLCPGGVMGDCLSDPAHCHLLEPPEAPSPNWGCLLSPHSPPVHCLSLHPPLFLCFPLFASEYISPGASVWLCLLGFALFWVFDVSVSLSLPFLSVCLSVSAPGLLHLCLWLHLPASLSLTLSQSLPPLSPISHLRVPILVVLGVPELHLGVTWCQLALR